MEKRSNPIFTTGEPGINRVWIFTRGKAGTLYLGWKERLPSGEQKRHAKSLGKAKLEEAKTEAEQLAVTLRTATPLKGHEDLTLGELIHAYLRERTPLKGQSTQKHDRRVLPLFLACWGAGRKLATLKKQDWDHFIRLRRSGRLAPQRRRPGPVRNRTLEQDLSLLRAVFHWAQEEEVISTVPMAQCAIPREENVQRPMLYEEEMQAMLEVADTVHSRCRLALLLAHDTGRRSKSIRELRWTDIDFDASLITWPADTDKEGRTHSFYAPESLITELRNHYRTEEVWVFPSERAPGQPVNRRTFDDWWERCEKAAGLAHVPGRKWHSTRRKWATERKHHPSVDVAQAGGWNGTQTLLKIYTQPDEETMRRVVTVRTPVLKPGRVKAEATQERRRGTRL